MYMHAFFECVHSAKLFNLALDLILEVHLN